MGSGAYYNEIDPHAAQWLRNLIAAGHLPAGDVDERSIRDVKIEDLRGYTQCHFFAGIGVWPYALRRAGWPDDRSVWTGSCPCQPFSSAGKGLGHEDERHLWPTWGGLIGESGIDVVFGEQVANGDGYAWIDLVGHDLEKLGYAFGALCPAACGVGAPHIRQRTYFVADSELQQQRGRRGTGGEGGSGNEPGLESGGCSKVNGVVHAQQSGLEGFGRHGGDGHESGRVGAGAAGSVAEAGQHGVLGDSECAKRGALGQRGDVSAGREQATAITGGAGPVNGFWAGADWVWCRDPSGFRWRPVEPGTFPLAHGIAARVVKLRAYGNAICAPLAEAFIRAYMLERGL